MSTLILLALCGLFVTNSGDTVLLTKTQQAMDFDGRRPAAVTYPSDGYVVNGVKPIRWASPKVEPVRKSLSDVVVTPVVKEEAPIPPTLKRVELVTSAVSTAGESADLGILGARSDKLGVSPDEILSYFEKKSKTNSGNEITGAFIIPNQTVQPQSISGRVTSPLQ